MNLNPEIPTIFPIAADVDYYKMFHPEQYHPNTTVVYTNFIGRSGKWTNTKNNGHIIFCGLQYYVINYLIEQWNASFFNLPKETAIANIKRYVEKPLKIKFKNYKKFEDLHDLGYLPLKIKALPEGSRVPYGIPMITLKNTHKKFSWLVNFIENSLSHEMWGIINSCTTMREYLRLFKWYAERTCDNDDHVKFQGHDFSNRGMFGFSAVQLSGMGALLAGTCGTDSVPALYVAEKYYQADIDNDLVGTSVPATEHSVMCTNIHIIKNSPEFNDIKNEFAERILFGNPKKINISKFFENENISDNLVAEYHYYKKLITEIYPEGNISIVADSYDFWGVIRFVLPALKREILNRNGKVIIRPDSGDPVDIICGTIFNDLVDSSKWPAPIVGISYTLAEAESNIIRFNARGDMVDHNDPTIKKYKYMNETGTVFEIVLEVTVTYKSACGSFTYIGDAVEKERRLYIYDKIEEIGLIAAIDYVFGGRTINSQGYKVLNEKIGAIYGDSITLERAELILKRLEKLKYASSNITFGIGSYTFQGNTTRDTHGIAIKATYCEAEDDDGNIIEINVSKAPKTDSGKKSPSGLLMVTKCGDKYQLEQNCTKQQEERGCLETVFEDGKLIKTVTLKEIRKRIEIDLNEQLRGESFKDF